jgi:hypothetical protein
MPGGFMGMDGKYHHPRMGPCGADGGHDPGDILRIGFPAQAGSGRGAEDLVTDADFIRCRLDCHRPRRRAQGLQLCGRDQTYLMHMQRIDPGRSKSRPPRCTGAPATPIGVKVEATLISATRPWGVST